MKQQNPNKTAVSSERGKRSKPAIVDTSVFLAATNGAGVDVKLAAREAAFSQGDPADTVFYIKAGRIQITVVSDQGKEGIIALLSPGDFFGEGCLSGQPLRLASAIATTETIVARVEKEAMNRLLHEKPLFSEMFTAFLLLRTIQVEADLVDHLFNSSEKRLARTLLLLANFASGDELHPIMPKISQEALAARVGTTRSRVNLFLNKFRKLGLIEYNGSMKIHPALLNVIVHD